MQREGTLSSTVQRLWQSVVIDDLQKHDAGSSTVAIGASCSPPLSPSTDRLTHMSLMVVGMVPLHLTYDNNPLAQGTAAQCVHNGRTSEDTSYWGTYMQPQRSASS